MYLGGRLSLLLVLLVALVTSTTSAPVKSTDSSGSGTPTKTQNDENTAKELEELSKTGHVLLPAAPVVAKVTEHARAETQESRDQKEEAKVAHKAGEDVAAPPSKRRLPVPEVLPADDTRLPVLSPSLDDLLPYARESDVDLSPRAVAEYLLVSSDFSGFDQALDDLFNTGVLSPAEILLYKDSVSRQYENLLQQVAQAESQYLQELSRVSPMDYFNTIQQPVRIYPEYPYNQNSLEYSDMDMERYRDQMPSLLNYGDQVIDDYRQRIPDYENKEEDEVLTEKDQTLDDVLSEMLNEYYGIQTPVQPEAEYHAEVPEDLAAYETTNDGNDVVDSSDDDDDDDDIKQFMAYLQQTLTAEEAGAGIVEVGDSKKPDNSDKSESNDIASQLEDLSPNPERQDSDAAQGSGDVEPEMIESRSS